MIYSSQVDRYLVLLLVVLQANMTACLVTLHMKRSLTTRIYQSLYSTDYYCRHAFLQKYLFENRIHG